MGAAFEVNRQMCDLEIARERWDKLGKEWDSKKKEIVYSIFNENDMEKKKMTKAEAFEWLKNKKMYVGGNSAAIQKKLFEAGFEWPLNNRYISNLDKPFLILSENGGIFYSNDMCHYLARTHEEISAEDILSIEIVEEEEDELNSYAKIAKLAQPLMDYLREIRSSERICISQENVVAEPMPTLISGGMKGC